VELKLSNESQISGRPASAREWLDLDPVSLMAGCAVDLYRASGPGGQKRNKTSSAVRLRHQATGLIVTAVESRSQHENRARALQRLRRAIALTQRNSVDASAAPPTFYAAALQRDPSLHVNTRHEDYCHIIQHVLDVLHANQASVADAAAGLNISTGQLIRFLAEDPDLWEHANRMRREFGQSQLRRV
jgi:hypothetical protein